MNFVQKKFRTITFIEASQGADHKFLFTHDTDANDGSLGHFNLSSADIQKQKKAQKEFIQQIITDLESYGLVLPYHSIAFEINVLGNNKFELSWQWKDLQQPYASISNEKLEYIKTIDAQIKETVTGSLVFGTHGYYVDTPYFKTHPLH